MTSMIPTADTFSIDATADDRFTVYSHFGPRRRVATVGNYSDARHLADMLAREVRITTRPVGNHGPFKAFSVPGVAGDDTAYPQVAKRRAHDRALDLAQTVIEGQ